MKLGLRGFLALASVAYLFCVLSKLLLLWTIEGYTDMGFVYDQFVAPTVNGIPYHAYSSISSPSTYYFVYPAIPAISIWLSGFHVPGKELYLVRMAWFTYPFILIAAYFLYLTCVELGIGQRRMLLFFLFAPSFLVFSFYSWDIIAASFVIAAIYYALKKKPSLTGFCLGVGFAAKSYPLLLLPVFFKEAQTWRNRLIMLVSALVGGLIPNLPFMLVDFNGWYHTIISPSKSQYLTAANTGLYSAEDSIWVVIRYYHLITQGRIVTALSWMVIAVAILYATFSKKPFLLRLWLVVAATVLVYPLYPPQFNVWLLPLFVLNPLFSYLPFLAFDLLDASIILLWFWVPNPVQAWGPIWNIFLTRIAILTALLVWVLHTRLTGLRPDSISWLRTKRLRT